MIIIRLMGGLGNQMFQYALGRTLEIDYGVVVKYDVGAYQHHESWNYLLDKYNVKMKYASKDEIKNIVGVNVSNVHIRRLVKRIKLMNNILFKKYYLEPHLYYDPKLKDLLDDDYYIEGYWSTEKYFASIKEVLLKEFTPLNQLSERNQSIVNRMEETNSVSVHIRRGDSADTSKIKKQHGDATADYFERSLEIINEKIENPVFFVFSDDVEWAKNFYNFKGETIFVNHNQYKDSHLDQYLMSRCKNNIIWGSTFSWWGAWMNTNPGKIVIAPKLAENENSTIRDRYTNVDWIII